MSVKYTLPPGCNVCGVERDDKVTAKDDYDPTIVGEDSQDVDKVNIKLKVIIVVNDRSIRLISIHGW